MYKTKRAMAEQVDLDKELRMLSTMVSPEEMNVVKYFKHKEDLKKRWEDEIN